MRALMMVCAAAFALSMIASIGAAAQASKIDKPIYGFYLGESKQSLLQRADKLGIAHERAGQMPKLTFPDNYIFSGSMDKSKQVRSVVVSFYKDSVGELNVHLVDNSERQYMQAAQSLEQSWNSFSGFEAQAFGPMYIVTVRDVLITLVSTNDETYIMYVHRAMMRAYSEERDSGALSR